MTTSNNVQEVQEARTLDRLARLSVPFLLSAIMVLGGVAWNDIKASSALIDAHQDSQIEEIATLIRANVDLTQALNTKNQLLEQLLRILGDETVDHETRIRALENWQRNVNAP